MSIHSDAADAAVADQAGALSAPARLGLLRFERLNEASWAMLYLDPRCETSLGLPAQALCSLIDAPYASLMEPSVRHRLHEDIQLQLAEHGSYQVSYLFHSPDAPYQVIEVGESLQRHGRPLLRGYLLRVMGNETLAGEWEVHTLALRSTLTLLQENQDLTQQRLMLAQARQTLLLELSRCALRKRPTASELAKLLVTHGTAAFAVDQVSLWRLDDNGLTCLTSDERITTPCSDHQRRLREQGLIEDASQVLLPPNTAAGTALDVALLHDDTLTGLLCLRRAQATTWEAGDLGFARGLADCLATLVRDQERPPERAHPLTRVMEASTDAFLLLDADGRLEHATDSFTRITGYPSTRLQGTLIEALPALENWSELLYEAWQRLAHQDSWQGELRCYRRDGESYWGLLSLSKILQPNGELQGYLGIFQDTSKTRFAQQQNDEVVFRDSLTGLANRNHFIARLEARLEQSNANREHSLLLVDVDNFKRVNDSLGHHIGDQLLVGLARRLRTALGKSALIARIASNEFAVLLEGMDAVAAAALARDTLVALDPPLYVEGHPTLISCSIGLTTARPHETDPQTLIKHAGLALHRAKANGGHQVQVFTEALIAEVSHKLFMQNNLRRALEQNELLMHYQPKVCLKRAKLLGLEALIRWQHPEKGMIRPDQFISVAEETGLIVPIGKWVIREVCRQLHQLDAAGFGDLQIAINLSPKQFTDPDLVQSFVTILEEEGIAPRRLELELTESLLLDATDATRETLEALKRLGMSLAMDDFGTGYSSLSYLKKFPIDIIKIDRSFIKDIPDNQDDMEITSAVIAMAHNLRLEVVAEGIETTEQLAFLRHHRCDIGQGYLFDKPIPAEQLDTALARYLPAR
ncbi:diguanylate cyclase [Pseudomonas oryzihabitans]|uniref:putative bifunctional diguanylate cyclase/phosphodiesterase n=1 Tax=Pseudomonas rhizoryzae TaxID=2571129 RepID=UPI00073787A3|nr:EAL domain-containing protein [Pseudomonas rhizoryzae]KTS77877.1 diguanylate cyclase [Pseudomonas psychrotolerans]KTT31239.1 diguanylate cyclase [Pseudomonas psychrotolerans]KTT33561.1 diguanylate cyclase [Pseudomonas psychrotolerans]KTT36302.1 diguanylate cyclase [Pseudomonas psychrotolerans]KTT43492.1 diguanylate cyclase [Pseudomonas psychrotolerans]